MKLTIQCFISNTVCSFVFNVLLIMPSYESVVIILRILNVLCTATGTALLAIGFGLCYKTKVYVLAYRAKQEGELTCGQPFMISDWVRHGAAFQFPAFFLVAVNAFNSLTLLVADSFCQTLSKNTTYKLSCMGAVTMALSLTAKIFCNFRVTSIISSRYNVRSEHAFLISWIIAAVLFFISFVNFCVQTFCSKQELEELRAEFEEYQMTEAIKVATNEQTTTAVAGQYNSKHDYSSGNHYSNGQHYSTGHHYSSHNHYGNDNQYAGDHHYSSDKHYSSAMHYNSDDQYKSYFSYENENCTPDQIGQSEDWTTKYDGSYVI